MDATTMVLALALGNLALCATLFFFEQSGHGGRPAVPTWGWSRLYQGAGWLLLAIGAAGVVPEGLALPIAYVLVFAGVAWESGAAWERAGRLRWRRATLPALGLAVAAFLLCWLIDPIGLRAVAASLVLGAFYLSLAAALARGWAAASMLQRFLALATTVLAIVVGARGALVLLAPAGWGWMTSDILRQLHSGALYLLALVGGFGWLLLGREREQAELARLEIVDPLTDVPNRRGFFQALAPWMALARRPGQPTALVVLDLDQFKRINDSYGHPAGDVVLAHLIDTCKRQLRDSDLLGRLVSVEFAILLPRTNLDDATMVAERMRAAIEAQRVKTERAMISLTASFGVTTIRPDDSTVTLLARADEALRVAKKAGRNRVEVAAPVLAPVEE
ncbi:GGDEF domain-containing protein [Telluria mixta]|uniref:diguanylate cyclase n=1 Tax=Telluria mixta TaxID=34071 RepID=A0ABT2C887_9BURK|nr:GGDEF domain-containing protein [Telluria mixta]MCS0633611.1 GGDEF domain-containing protein [Telluria mixta]WEM95923.1 GGDEF domain-containing protein [Telluria mixta]